MNEKTKKLYRNDDYVRKELIQARKLMGNKNTDFDLLVKALGMMYIYCNKKMMDIVYTHLIETTMRMELLRR